MKVYVVSKAANSAFALDADNIIDTCVYGPDPHGDARSYAFDHTKATDEPAYVFEVLVVPKGKYEVKKEVVFRPQQD